jgi:hypothetical protein
MGARTLDLDYRKMRVLLKQWRTEAKLTQRCMAERLRKPHTYVYKVEVGDRRIDPLEFIYWCKACGVDPAKKLKQLYS